MHHAVVAARAPASRRGLSTRARGDARLPSTGHDRSRAARAHESPSDAERRPPPRRDSGASPPRRDRRAPRRAHPSCRAATPMRLPARSPRARADTWRADRPSARRRIGACRGSTGPARAYRGSSASTALQRTIAPGTSPRRSLRQDLRGAGARTRRRSWRSEPRTSRARSFAAKPMALDHAGPVESLGKAARIAGRARARLCSDRARDVPGFAPPGSPRRDARARRARPCRRFAPRLRGRGRAPVRPHAFSSLRQRALERGDHFLRVSRLELPGSADTPRAPRAAPGGRLPEMRPILKRYVILVSGRPARGRRRVRTARRAHGTEPRPSRAGRAP